MTPEQQTLIDLVIERAEQACRYAVKHQNFSSDESEYRSGFENAAAVCAKAIRDQVMRHIEDDFRRSPLTIGGIKLLQTGDRVRVTWSGGNGPCEYTIERTDYGAILCCTDGLPPGYPGTLFDPISDAKAIVAIHKVERIKDAGQTEDST